MIIIGEKIHASCTTPKSNPPYRPFVDAAQQLFHGDAAARGFAERFIAYAATSQAKAGAAWLDINVDEISSDANEREAAMRRFVKIVLRASPLPLCIDAADTRVLCAGLSACHAAGRATILNSITPNRLDALELAVRFNSGVVLLPTPANSVPATAEARCELQQELLAHVDAAGIAREKCFLDPIVMPIAMDPRAVIITLETVKCFRKFFGEKIHVIGGVSNVSYGLPARANINRVFAHLFFNAGAGFAILNPVQVTHADILSPDTSAKNFQLARALLEGEDEYGMAYIDAFRQNGGG